MKGLIFVVLLSVAIFVASASESEGPETQGQCPDMFCITFAECMIVGGSAKCGSCQGFKCRGYSQREIGEEEQFEEFTNKEYKGSPRMLPAAYKALTNKED